MKRRDFKKEDFASFHPGGSLGKKLFVKVDDLLRKDNLPIVSRETKLKDAIIVMSEGRLGSVIIEDENKKVIGVLSDGDLRRALMKDGFSIDCNVDCSSPDCFEVCFVGCNDLGYRDWETDRKSTRLNSSHITRYRMPSSA